MNSNQNHISMSRLIHIAKRKISEKEGEFTTLFAQTPEPEQFTRRLQTREKSPTSYFRERFASTGDQASFNDLKLFKEVVKEIANKEHNIFTLDDIKISGAAIKLDKLLSSLGDNVMDLSTLENAKKCFGHAWYGVSAPELRNFLKACSEVIYNPTRAVNIHNPWYCRSFSKFLYCIIILSVALYIFKDIYPTSSFNLNLANNDSDALMKTIQSLGETNKALGDTNSKQEGTIQSLEDSNKTLGDTNSKQEGTIQALEDTNKALGDTNSKQEGTIQSLEDSNKTQQVTIQDQNGMIYTKDNIIDDQNTDLVTLSQYEDALDASVKKSFDPIPVPDTFKSQWVKDIATKSLNAVIDAHNDHTTEIFRLKQPINSDVTLNEVI